MNYFSVFSVLKKASEQLSHNKFVQLLLMSPRKIRLAVVVRVKTIMLRKKCL